MNSSPKSLGFLFLLLLTALSSHAKAASLRMVTGDDYPPFISRTANGQLTGFAIELISQAMSSQKENLVIDTVPWARAEIEVKKMKADATFPYIKTEEREKEYAFSVPIESIRSTYYMRRSDPLRSNRLEELQGKKICLPIGYATDESLLKAFRSGKIERVSPPDARSCALMLQQKRIDAFLENQYNGHILLKQINPERASDFTSLDAGFPAQTLHLIVSHNHKEKDRILSILHKGLIELEKTGKINSLRKKYEIK